MRGSAVAASAPRAKAIAKLTPLLRMFPSLEDKRCNFGLGLLSKVLAGVTLESGAVSKPGRPSMLVRFFRVQ